MKGERKKVNLLGVVDEMPKDVSKRAERQQKLIK